MLESAQTGRIACNFRCVLVRVCRKLKDNKYSGIDAFEVATINNLNLETSEEVLSLVPSLKKKGVSADLIDELLSDLRKYQST